MAQVVALCGLLGASGALAGCCGWRAARYGSVLGTFELYVIVGYDTKLCCPLPVERIPRLIAPGEPIRIWLRAVYRDQVNKPVPGISVTLGLVDSFGGDSSLSLPGVSLQPRTIVTGKDGYATNIAFMTPEQGHYRIKAVYKDKDATGVSYGPLLIVQR